MTGYQAARLCEPGCCAAFALAARISELETRNAELEERLQMAFDTYPSEQDDGAEMLPDTALGKQP